MIAAEVIRSFLLFTSLEEFLYSFAAKLKFALNDIEGIKLVLRLKTREVEIEMEARNEDI